MKDGLHPKLPFRDYALEPRINQSLLAKFSRSPAHAREYIANPSMPTDDMFLGTLIHMAVLEPEEFKKRVVVAPKVDRRRSEGKAIWEKFQADNKGREVADLDEYNTAVNVAKSVHAHPLVADLLAAKGVNEVTAAWTDTRTGVKCKARIDRLCSLFGYTIVLDLKSTRSAEDYPFSKSIADYKYHLQAAFYMDGLTTLAPAKRKYWIVPVEKEPPYCCQVFEIEEPAIQQGRAEYQQYLDTYLDCVKSGIWPGYSTGVVPIGLPKWYRPKAGQ